jgi:hypothetical protein
VISKRPFLFDHQQSSRDGRADQLLEQAKDLVYGLEAFSDATEALVEGYLDKASKELGGLGISDDEKRMILQAMSLRPGHWYKCPNGHVYCITGKSPSVLP